MGLTSTAATIAALAATLTDLGRRRRPPRRVAGHLDAIVVGGGFSGMGMAHHLLARGVDVTILERADAVGGTWRDNTYPGAACDIPAHLYSFSFLPNDDWSSVFPKQPEIRAYLERCADELDLRDRFVFGATVVEARWEDDEQRWRVATADGRAFSARLLVGAFGPLSDPRVPDLPGVDTFAGPAFHSATWDHDLDLAGKRVVVVGTGASAIQFVPEVARAAAHTTVFQRTAPWIIPRFDTTFRASTKAAFRAVPALRQAYRGLLYGRQEVQFLGFRGDNAMMRAVSRLARRHRETVVTDPVMREQVTPTYAMGCKRILVSNDWYPTLVRDDVTLVTSAVAEVTPDGVVDADGTHHAADVLVWGTGFAVDDPLGPCEIVGRGGASLRETWGDRPTAHLGSTVPGFPNLFLLLGPNTGLGHNSMIYMMESQFAYVADAVDTMAARGLATVEVRRDVHDAFQVELDRRNAATVWATGCDSWYLKDGRNFTLWPGFTFEFRRRTARFDLPSYVVAPERTAVGRRSVASVGAA